MGVKIILEGVITSGVGEGAIFMSMEHYKNEIKKRLGFYAYPGTLNLKINKEQLSSLKNFNTIRIKGYEKGNKTFGGASCYKAKIDDMSGAVIIPDLTRHKEDVIEFISPVNLKSELKLKDGDKVKIIIQ